MISGAGFLGGLPHVVQPIGRHSIVQELIVAAEYATLWPSRSLFRFHPVKVLFFPLVVISDWCCLLRALYHYVASGSIVWRGRAVKVR